MEKILIEKIRSLARHNAFSSAFLRAAEVCIFLTSAFLFASFFIALPKILWWALVAFSAAALVRAFVSSRLVRPGERECYSRIDAALELSEAAVTYHGVVSGRAPERAEDGRAPGAPGSPEDAVSAGIGEIAVEDFRRRLLEKKPLVESDEAFDEAFGRARTSLPARLKAAAIACLVMSAALFWINSRAPGPVSPGETADDKELRSEAARVVDAIAASGEGKKALPEAVAEVRKAGEALKNPMTQKELSGTLREAAEKLKAIQNEGNARSVRDEVKKIESEVESLIAGKDGEKISDDEKKALAEKMDAFKKLVEDYMKKSNDKDFKKVEKELSDLVAALNAKKDSARSRTEAASGKEGKGAGQGQKEMSAEMKSKLKQLGRLSGKELLEKLKNDKELQEMYAAMKAMSEAAEDSQGGKEGKPGEGAGKSGEGRPGEGKGGDKKGSGKGGGGVSPESLGLQVPKPGKGSSNLKEGPSEAPVMVPQERNNPSKKPVKSGEWKAMFEGTRFEVKTEKTKVEGVHDSAVKTSSIEGKAIPLPGEAKEGMKQVVESEAGNVESLVSSEAVPDDVKRSVSDYFRKLNNDYDQKGGGKDGGSGK